jgi:hypothetical protein
MPSTRRPSKSGVRNPRQARVALLVLTPIVLLFLLVA